MTATLNQCTVLQTMLGNNFEMGHSAKNSRDQ